MPPRLGPRPLPLHLASANLTWLISLVALPRLRNGSLPWSPALAEAGRALNLSLAEVDPKLFAAAVRTEVIRRQVSLAAGIKQYRDHPFRRRQDDPPVVWQAGTTRLLAYCPEERAGRPLLVVPSLINRAYILDLTPPTSLMRWLAKQGFQPFLVDWDRPGPEERQFTLSDYIVGRLEVALDHVLQRSSRPPAILGYCMGGLLALALATRRQDHVAGLALLATPWDFHAGHGAQGRLAAAGLNAFLPLLDRLGELPVDAIQAFFAALDPQMVPRKFVGFSQVDPKGSKAQNFVALEDWLNDGVPLAAPVARECLGGWYGENSAARGRWRIAGQAVDPRDLRRPSLSVIPAQDRIVPPAAAEALAAALPLSEVLRPPAGHVGMIVSNGARKRVWRPLRSWLEARFA